MSLASTANKQAARTSKKSQKHVLLPSDPQTKPLLDEQQHDLYPTSPPPSANFNAPSSTKSPGELMSKHARKRAGFKRLTAYCIADSLSTRHLTSFLKREHNVAPRVFDEAIYVVYHLPLLPGYSPETNIRSSPHTSPSVPHPPPPVSISEPHTSTLSSSPLDSRHPPTLPLPQTHIQTPTPTAAAADPTPAPESSPAPLSSSPEPTQVAEVVFFTYGVIVFFGLSERQERDVIDDVRRAGILKRPFLEQGCDDWEGVGVGVGVGAGDGVGDGDRDSKKTVGTADTTIKNRWEVEECHYVHDPTVAYPRVYNDFFTLKSPSPSLLQTLSISHALAQSTLLAHYESTSYQILHSSPLMLSIPTQLAHSGRLKLGRREAMKLTGRLFRLRRDVILVKGVLDVPGVFEALEGSGSGSGGERVGELYEAVREYFEIKHRVKVVNEKLGVASGFLDAIHDHLNNNEMTRITWIVIWLILIAVLVELGEILARLVAHATLRDEPPAFGAGAGAGAGGEMGSAKRREAGLRALEKMIMG